jgi:hypothetical protein
MAHHSQDTDEDEITESDDTVGAATFGCASLRVIRQVTPPSTSADLRTALAMPTTFGPKLFEITVLIVVSSVCKVKVKDTGDLLLLRDWLFEELGPPYMWIFMLSVVEWEQLTDDQKELHRTMRNSWLSTAKPRTPCSSTGFGGSSRNRQNLSPHSTKCLQKSRSTRLTVVHLHPFVPRHRCLYRAQAPCSWPQDVSWFQG